MALTRYQRFAKIALELAAESEFDMTHSLCALVVSKNEVLSIGYNQSKTHPISEDTPQKQLHAEMHAVLRCAAPEGTDVVVARSKPSGRPGLAKPCPACEGVLRRFGVRRVFYTVNCESADNPQLEEMRL